MLICCNEHELYFAEICCLADANHSAWIVRGIFCASITTLDEENINVISMDELRLIREWIKPFTEMKSYPFRLPDDCSQDHGRRPAMHYIDQKGYMQLAPLPIRGPSPPICVREVSQELRRLVEKYQHHAWSVAETRIQEEGFHRDDVKIVVEMCQQGLHLTDAKLPCYKCGYMASAFLVDCPICNTQNNTTREMIRKHFPTIGTALLQYECLDKALSPLAMKRHWCTPRILDICPAKQKQINECGNHIFVEQHGLKYCRDVRNGSTHMRPSKDGANKTVGAFNNKINRWSNGRTMNG